MVELTIKQISVHRLRFCGELYWHAVGRTKEQYSCINDYIAGSI
jgi:hypothetical protein